MLYLNIEEEIVITEGNIKYLSPVSEDFQVECRLSSKDDLLIFKKTLQAKNKARIKLSAVIYQHQKLCVNFEGTFVALKRKNEVV